MVALTSAVSANALGFRGQLQIIRWDASCQEDLWRCEEGRLEEGVSLESCHLDLMFWSDASDQGWGDTACDQVASGHWGVGEVGLCKCQGVIGC